MRFLKYPLYLGFFLGALLFFSYLGFPWDLAKDRAFEMIRQSSRTELRAKRLEPSWFTGIEAEQLEVLPPNWTESIEISKLKARALLIPLLTGKKGLEFDLELAKGQLGGVVVQQKSGTDVEAKLDHLELALLSAVSEATGLRLAGQLDGHTDLFLSKVQPQDTEGELSIKASDLEILKGSKAANFPVPELVLGNLNWQIPVKAGKAQLKKLRLEGENLEAELDGEILLAQPLHNSTLNFSVSFKPTPAFLKKEPLIGALLNNIKQAQGTDGYYTYAISGTAGHPRAFPRRR